MRTINVVFFPACPVSHVVRYTGPALVAPTKTHATVIPAKAGIQENTLNKKQPAVYILASRRNGTLYTGVTTSLVKRVWEHRNDIIEGFTKKYRVHLLVYYELHDDIISAITREKQIKKWNRAWKLELIEKQNPDWRDLWEELP